MDGLPSRLWRDGCTPEQIVRDGWIPEEIVKGRMDLRAGREGGWTPEQVEEGWTPINRAAAKLVIVFTYLKIKNKINKIE